jgi:hypothetical protein
MDKAAIAPEALCTSSALCVTYLLVFILLIKKPLKKTKSTLDCSHFYNFSLHGVGQLVRAGPVSGASSGNLYRGPIRKFESAIFSTFK